ncbi:Rho termination factor N-terminal domain-containing protein [Streptococcus suis]|uniref:Rho termination factor N-terminal domain-containing protein n=1 Tax=Streptococcus suis TaxID=1307 RepID=UPI000CF73CE5|nr:Rho termination factor N-terminal domain-containing protein [Streptococcus suis]
MGMLLRRHREEQTERNLSEMTTKELQALAKEKQIKGYTTMTKEELKEALNAL